MFLQRLSSQKLQFMANKYVRWLDIYKWRILFSLLIISLSIIMVTESKSWILDALDALRIPYAIVLTAFIMFVFIKGNKMLATAGVIALLILAPGIYKYFKPEQAPIAKSNNIFFKNTKPADFSAVHFNVKENNRNILSVAEAALKSDADLLSFQELQQRTLLPMDSVLKTAYPYSMQDLSIPGYGMAVYSKYPLIENKVIIEHDFPLLTGVLQVKGKSMQFISATTSSPKNSKGFNEQIKQFKILSSYADTISIPLLVMGDMNSVPWSVQITNFLKQTKLKDSRKNLSSTFPANSIFQIPIDYIFHSADLNCVNFGTLQQTSSNHLGIIGFYQFIEKRK